MAAAPSYAADDDLFVWLDGVVLNRLLACLSQRDALALASLAAPWPCLVAAHLRRITLAADLGDLPLGAVLVAARHCKSLREVTFNGSPCASERFWNAAATLMHRLPGQELEVIALRGVCLQPQSGGVCGGLEFFKKMLSELPRFPALARLLVEQVPLSCETLNSLTCALRSLVPGTAITSIGLRDCSLEYKEAEAVCAALGESVLAGRLLRLDISTNFLSHEGAASLAAVLPGLSALQALCLAGTALGHLGVAALAPGLASVQATLTELDLSANGIGAEGVEALVPASLKLEVLSLRQNWIGPHGAGMLIPVLRSMAGSLRSFDVTSNKLGPDGVRVLLEQLPHLPRLRALFLAENHFATADFASAPFANLAAAAPALEELDVTACHLGSDDAALRCVVVGLPTSLRSLNLGASNLAAPQLRLLLGALPDMPWLERLSLVMTQLDDEAAAVLGAWRLGSSGVPTPGPLPRLRVLDISGNYVSGLAAGVLAASFRQPPSLFQQLRGARLPAAATVARRHARPKTMPRPATAGYTAERGIVGSPENSAA